MEKTVVELFAGVGGFRVGLNNIKKIDKNGRAIEHGNFKFVWSNQWEPSTKVQHAFECYNLRFNDSLNSNQDISKVNKKDIPNHTLLCGGFPCQDYSVARSLSKEKGIEGKKGVLWWQINEILEIKKPPFVLLENVDRLIKSPSKQRGRDFAIMLKCFELNGYSVQWRVINAANYGHPQRRRRIFIFASKNNTNYYNSILKNVESAQILEKTGIFAINFPIENHDNIKIIDLDKKYNDLLDISNNFSAIFENAGFMRNGIIYTEKVYAREEKQYTLRKIVQKNVDSHYFLNDEKINKFKYLRGKKSIERVRPDGSIYHYSEGAMSPYDSLDLPGRTMLTSEGTTNRSTHIIKDGNNFRILTPVECERLNQFPDDWTNSGMPEKRRYFMMGNALVCGIIEKLGITINSIIDLED